MELNGRAKVYQQVLTSLSTAEQLTGKIIKRERGARHLSLFVRLYDPRQLKKSLALAEPLALHCQTAIVIAQRSGGLVVYQFQLPAGAWEKYTRADLPRPERAGVGLAESRRQIDVDFDIPHLGVFGTTGSGKTETVKSMLAGLFIANNPDVLQAIILDMKGKFADFQNVAHLRGVQIARDDDAIDHALAYVNTEIINRERASNFDARRLVLVVDEAESIFQSKARMQVAKALVKRGREVRVNALFATQEPHKGDFRKLLGQLNNRWVGYVDDPNTAYQITGRAETGADKLTGKGDFLHLAPGGIHDRFQAVLTTRADLDSLPRAELAPPEFDPVDPVDTDLLPDAPEDNGRGGRPYEEVKPEVIAYYLVRGPGRVTRKIAKDVLDLGQPLHLRHKDFARTLICEVNRLLKAEGA